MDRVARPWRAASASPWRAKMGDTSEIVNIFVAVEGGPFGEKTNFRKKSQCQKTERGDPWGFLNTQSVVKYQRN